jgi:hypothetical protein
MQNRQFYNSVKRHIRKFLNLPLHLRMASSTAFNHMPYYHYLLRQSDMFCTHNPLQCSYMDVSCCVQKCDFLMVNLKEWYTCIMFCFKLGGGGGGDSETDQTLKSLWQQWNWKNRNLSVYSYSDMWKVWLKVVNVNVPPA